MTEVYFTTKIEKMTSEGHPVGRREVRKMEDLEERGVSVCRNMNEGEVVSLEEL